MHDHKITPEKIVKALQLKKKQGLNNVQIAERFGVSPHYLCVRISQFKLAQREAMVKAAEKRMNEL